MSDDELDNVILSSLVSIPDDSFDKGLFRDPKVARKILERVALDTFGNEIDIEENKRLNKFDEFLSGRIEPKFVIGAANFGMLPSFQSGLTYLIVPIDMELTKEDEREMGKKLLKEILPLGPEILIRTLSRMFLISSEKKQREYIEYAESEIEREEKEKNKHKVVK